MIKTPESDVDYGYRIPPSGEYSQLSFHQRQKLKSWKADSVVGFLQSCSEATDSNQELVLSSMTRRASEEFRDLLYSLGSPIR
jgi:hypothetical protein